MSGDPTPITLAEGEALYLNADLPDEGWEARFMGKPDWRRPRSFNDTAIVVARRIQWTPKPGDRVRVGKNGRGEVLAVHEQTRVAWVQIGSHGPLTYRFDLLSPESPS